MIFEIVFHAKNQKHKERFQNIIGFHLMMSDVLSYAKKRGKLISLTLSLRQVLTHFHTDSSVFVHLLDEACNFVANIRLRKLLNESTPILSYKRQRKTGI